MFGRQASMPEGTIKRIVMDRGFGFIDVGGSKDLFFHFSVLQGARMEELQEGQRVEYEEGEGPKGPRATMVRPV
jgi:CspA family cold shock protein